MFYSDTLNITIYISLTVLALRGLVTLKANSLSAATAAATAAVAAIYRYVRASACCAWM